LSERESDEAGRKLAAVMFTDIVGYTLLSQKDESLALELLEEHRKIVRPILAKHGGIEIKTMGDAFLVEFSSALGAVRCGLDIQQAIGEMNSEKSQGKRIRLRIGIHLGDVIHSAGDIYGDAVNVASRIQPLAEPGGICVTEQVYVHIRNKLEIRMTSLGRRDLKNVDQPIEIYKLEIPGMKEGLETKESKAYALDRSRLAVLPLVNMINESGNEYFADGLTEELTSTISRISSLHVISRTSAAQYRNASKKILDIGRELGVGSVIEGSVRKSSNRVRISVQLIDVQTDEHVWAENYDRQFEDVFAIQSDIAQRVAGSLMVQLAQGEKKQVERVATKDSEAHNLYFKGRYFWRQRTGEGLSRAIEFFKRAIEKDPSYALAYSGLADCYTASAVYGHTPVQATLAKQRLASLRAVDLDSTLAEARNSLAISLAMNNEFSEAENEFHRAIELNSNYSTIHHWYAQVLAVLDRQEEAIREAERARELDPLSPTTFMTLGFVHTLAHNPLKAIAELENYRDIDPNYLPVNLLLAIAYTESSRFSEAAKTIRSTVDQLPVGKFALAYVFAKEKKQREALEVLAELEKAAEDKFVKAEIAGIYAILGLKEKSSQWFDQAYSGGQPGPKFLLRFYPWSSVVESVGAYSSIAKPKLATQMTSLEKFLSDELPSKSTLLIVGGSEVGKELVGYRIVSLGLSKGDFCLYLTGLSTREVLRGMSAFGISIPEESDNLFWISGEGGALTYTPNDLSGLSFNLKEVLKKNHDRKIRIVTDLLSPLLMLNSKETVYRFLSQLFTEIKQYDVVLVATLEEAMHEPEIIAAMKQLFDGFLEVRSSDGKNEIPTRTVHVKKLRGVSVPGESRSFAL
jgi:adenylate cyclase